MTGLKPYQAYRGSGIDWIEKMPSDWRTEKISRITSMTVGWTPPTADDASFLGDNLWANISDLGDRVIRNTVKRISDDAIKAARIRRSPQGSLLYSFKLSVGRVSFAGVDMYTNEAIATFKASRHLVLDYAYYAFPLFLIANASENIYGAKILNQERILGTRIALPPVPVQRNIARYLDQETEKIDSFISDQESLTELLVERRAATISHAVTRGIDPGAYTRPSGFDWFGNVPANWSIVPFPMAVTYREGPGIGASDFREEGIPLLRVAGVRGRFATLEGCNYLDPATVSTRWRRFQVQRGDLLVSASASMGTVAEAGDDVVGAVPYTGIIRMAPRPQTDREFLRYFLQSAAFLAQIDRLKTGSTIQHYGPEHLRQMCIALPPVPEQRAIAAHVMQKIVELDTAIAEARTAVMFLRERRAALVSALVTGKVDVSEVV
ncbi:restriction endonuclease subunit S [Clavibacter michiganensis]|uniref:restriction endonuclease subunit S n=3 Tax=Clavibacter michiganensis TaxID=28447 RepID=UPI001198206D|nr:restriction endonuclease subunit S [Clavibacter michiganensis]MDO4032335.1 restriction endonuclease subunit S [Clavibacter michiganensis]MDO4081667.1 restriction endonuclease subunit S [Clavibacter michiganensis]